MKNRIPQGWMIPQYRTLKSKLPKYRLKKGQHRKPPCPPPIDNATYNPPHVSQKMSLYFRPAPPKRVESLLYRRGTVFQPA